MTWCAIARATPLIRALYRKSTSPTHALARVCVYLCVCVCVPHVVLIVIVCVLFVQASPVVFVVGSDDEYFQNIAHLERVMIAIVWR